MCCANVFFLDHSPDAKTFVNDEYTLISNREDLSNIFLQYPNFLPTLTVYDSDREELPLMPKNLTVALIEGEIDDANSDINIKKNEIQLISVITCDACKERKSKEISNIQNEISEINSEITGLTNILANLEEDKIHIIWIKLPNGKELGLGESKVLTLEYATPKENSNEDYKLDIFSPSKHHVYYTIKRPSDYVFASQKIFTENDKGKKIEKKSWKKDKQDLMYISETNDALTVTSKSDMQKPIELRYSFKPGNHIIAFPVVVLGILTAASFFLIYLGNCVEPQCTVPDLFNLDPHLLEKRLEISLSVIGAAFVLPRLIKNDFVRHNIAPWHLIPIGLTIFGLLF
jgi:hypothetical protein